MEIRDALDELLRHGALPLSTATLVIDRWTEAQRT